MEDNREALQREIDEHRKAISSIEEQLHADTQGTKWPPKGLYLLYYAVAGLVLGVVGSLNSFVFNVVGSIAFAQDPILILRVFGTFFVGESAITTPDIDFLMLVLMTHFSIGSAAGAIYYVVVSKHFSERSYAYKSMLGGAWGLVMWLVGFYLVIPLAQPALVGKAYILDLMPIWIAGSTHLVYGLTLGLLEPLSRFVPRRTAPSELSR